MTARPSVSCGWSTAARPGRRARVARKVTAATTSADERARTHRIYRDPWDNISGYRRRTMTRHRMTSSHRSAQVSFRASAVLPGRGSHHDGSPWSQFCYFSGPCTKACPAALRVWFGLAMLHPRHALCSRLQQRRHDFGISCPVQLTPVRTCSSAGGTVAGSSEHGCEVEAGGDWTS